MKICIDCKKYPSEKRRRCKQCCLIYNRKRAKDYYHKLKSQGIEKKRYGKINCVFCGKEFVKNRPNQIAHGKCKTYKTVKHYNLVPRSNLGNTVGRQTIIDLGLNIENFDVHHLDENPLNNQLSNLLILSKSNHSKLHSFLTEGRSLSWKQLSSNSEICWNTLRDQLTTTWLEKANVIRLKITGIGQSAAEPLNSNNIYIIEHEERSETMH